MRAIPIHTLEVLTRSLPDYVGGGAILRVNGIDVLLRPSVAEIVLQLIDRPGDWIPKAELAPYNVCRYLWRAKHIIETALGRRVVLYENDRRGNYRLSLSITVVKSANMETVKP